MLFLIFTISQVLSLLNVSFEFEALIVLASDRAHQVNSIEGFKTGETYILLFDDSKNPAAKQPQNQIVRKVSHNQLRKKRP